MFQTHSPESPLTMIERPRCPKCRIRIMLVGIEPSFAGPDLRTCECPKCKLAYKALTEDPMQSNIAAGWLKGELALQLPFLQISESMGNHDSKIVDAASVD